jgi:hypothetical protein
MSFSCLDNGVHFTGLDAHLGLRERLASRIEEIHKTIGEDAAVLDPGELINEEQ